MGKYTSPMDGMSLGLKRAKFVFLPRPKVSPYLHTRHSNKITEVNNSARGECSHTVDGSEIRRSPVGR